MLKVLTNKNVTVHCNDSIAMTSVVRQHIKQAQTKNNNTVFYLKIFYLVTNSSSFLHVNGQQHFSSNRSGGGSLVFE